MSMIYDHIRVTPLATSVGAEISGVDLATPPGEPGLAEIRRALGEYGVVFFRDQQLTPEQHIALARCFGAIDVNRFFAVVPGYPMIAEVRKEPEQQRNIGNGWHTDHSYDEAPALGSMLYAREVPKTGGDTLFASMYAAYDALSDGLKSTLEGLRAVHSSRHLRPRGGGAAGRSRGPHSQRRARDAGRRASGRHPPPRHRPQGALRQSRVHRAFRGLDRGGVAPALDYLYRHAVRPEFTCRFQWREGSLGFWDNRSTWHFAVNDYHGERRLLHRITIAGQKLS
jgi:taurine dioxygenase